MKIEIHRGQNQIGGNLIEIATEQACILLDAGCELDEAPDAPSPLEPLLRDKRVDAIFLSHYHRDHMGLVYGLSPEMPVYMGTAAFRMVKASDSYKAVPSISLAGFLDNGVAIHIGDMVVTPFLCDHSAFDSYMLLVEAGGETVLYTGDFRANGRKSFQRLIRQLPVHVDVLICEGTTLSRPGARLETETELEDKATALFASTEGPVFVLQSSMNVDRIVTMTRAAKKTNRVILQDLYMAEVASAAGASIPNPRSFHDVKVFLTRPYPKEHKRYQLFGTYGASRIGRAQIAGERFVLFVRTSMLVWLRMLSKQMSFANGLLVYSLWNGYREKEDMKAFLEACEGLGLTIVPLHTSGHADSEAIDALIQQVNPQRILPVHTENAPWFDGKGKSFDIMSNGGNHYLQGGTCRFNERTY